MYLKELTINGFKSFAKKSELEFSAPVTAVVGPNGSGKSNIAESFRFVLGEQSVKSMRGKRGEDLIWGGSEKIARGNRAAVELVFDNTNRVFTLDFDEVKIERTVHRDGQNEYKLNGSVVRLKDIHELLANANIGSTGHHIISQGEADRVLSAGAKERREMIEDALGLKVFQLKKQETDRKLQKTSENIAQVESLRREAAPHLKYLKKQVERAERSLEVQKELRATYAEYLKREDVYLAYQFDALTVKRHEPSAELERLQDAIAQAKKLTDDTEDDSGLAKEVLEQESQYRATVQERQKAQHEFSQLQGQIAFLERRINEVKKTNNTSNLLVPQAHLEKLIIEVTQAAEKALVRGGEGDLKRALTDLVHQLRMFLKKSQGEVIDTTKEDKKELEKLSTLLEEARDVVSEKEAAEQSAEATLATLRAAKVSDLESKRTAERDMFTLIARRRELESDVQRIDSELSVLQRDRDEFKRELQEAVSLLGRGAADYYSLSITDASGAELTQEMIVTENRDEQRTRRRNVEKLKIRLEELGIGATDELLLEYKNAQERDQFLETELNDLHASVENLRTLMDELQGKLEEQFVAGVEKITTEFNRFFTLMFGGGSAGLERVTVKSRQSDEEGAVPGDSYEGIELAVSLPNKRVRGLDMLSGGERALTSIALIFAMSQVNPPPFIILDETDAALDEANSRRYGDMIEALAKKSQLVLITHNRETMSRAGILYGITMGSDGVSKVLSVKFDEAAMNAK